MFDITDHNDALSPLWLKYGSDKEKKANGFDPLAARVKCQLVGENLFSIKKFRNEKIPTFTVAHKCETESVGIGDKTSELSSALYFNLYLIMCTRNGCFYMNKAPSGIL